MHALAVGEGVRYCRTNEGGMIAETSGFGALLRRYRTAAGLTQEALAKRAGLSMRGVSDLERGVRRVPYPDTVERLAEALGLGAAEQTVLRAARRRTLAVARACAGPATERRHPSSSLAGLIELPLVGRTAHFDKLAELHHNARQGRAQMAVIEGESGIGKTRLADEFLRWSEDQGAEILRGRAFETGGRLPYQPVVDALRSCVEREHAPEGLLPDVWLAELTRLLPELRERCANLPVSTGDEAVARTRLFEAVARLGHALSERAPLVLFVDDVQWADEASFDVIHYLARRWAGRQTRALLLVSIRSEALAATPALGIGCWGSSTIPSALG
jgi:transcriptional regulator with XRE-family HTH domain